MNKVSIGALPAVLSLVLVGTVVLAAETMTPGWGESYSSNQLIGIRVLNQEGEELGRVHDMIIDSEGHVPFAIVFQGGMWGIGGKAVAVPYRALTLDRSGRHLVLDTPREKFLSAPDYRMRDLADEKWAEHMYRYFGLRPYWIEEGDPAGGQRGTITEETITEEYEYP